jgi:hypothetical protein
MPINTPNSGPDADPAPALTDKHEYPWPRTRRPIPTKIPVVSEFRPVRHLAHKN